MNLTEYKASIRKLVADFEYMGLIAPVSPEVTYDPIARRVATTVSIPGLCGTVADPEAYIPFDDTPSYCPDTGMPLIECMCEICMEEQDQGRDLAAEETDRTPTVPSMPVVNPEVCQSYYGFACECPIKHPIKRHLW